MNSESELREMIADYMERGFLENIIDMFKHDSTLYSMVGDLISDERIRVRIGITALMEELAGERPQVVSLAVPSLVPLLSAESPTVRGDAAYLMGLTGDSDAIEKLRPLLRDSNPRVVEIVEEVLGG
ncbi:hypothetical protein BMS3Bbin06_00220 [bacterium BMS3Bbin06]|nr:hypothetical protein BMS3Abin08_01276 [bacterium BMS3Abin08]GBE33707.1 hypothetical protein BMS3Bbin06_00220 [bacterium BMS3Bbin06]HDO35043.1 HEAT repeat domain-containing protein [Nitrospirota bacterium]HDY70376.1 HEAT repeat domain-containing protein [Nitrospirota bacterium]